MALCVHVLQVLGCGVHSRDSVGHPVGSEGPHHAQLLQGVLVLPLLGELLLLRTLTVHKLLPPLGRALVCVCVCLCECVCACVFGCVVGRAGAVAVAVSGVHTHCQFTCLIKILLR